MKILTPNKAHKKHLEEVKEEMKDLGPPTIKMVDRDKYLVAVEGSHRLNAAKDLGLPVKVKLVDPESFTTNHDFRGMSKKIRYGKIAQNVEIEPQTYVTIADKDLEFV